MALPKVIQILIADALYDMRHHDQYQLGEKRRHAIYQALNPSIDFTRNTLLKVIETRHLDISFGHRGYGYLAIITAKYVLPFWEHYAPGMIGINSDRLWLPYEMIAAAEGILQGSISIDEVIGDFCGEFHDFEQAWYYVNFDTYWAGDAAHAALGMVLGDPPFDHDGLTAFGDAAIAAELAYSTIDLTYPLDRIKNEPYFQVDVQKRQEFWEWWLTEAIPAAWAMAERTHNST